MKVLLIWPAVSREEVRHGGNFIPLGLGYLAANLSERHEVHLWDGVLSGHEDNRQVFEEVERLRPDVVGVSIWIFSMRSAASLLRQLKARYPGLPLVVGGPQISGLQARSLSLLQADFAVVGDGEVPFNHLLEQLERGRPGAEALSRIRGLVYRTDDGDVRVNPAAWDELTNIKYPDYERIGLNAYFDHGFGSGLHRSEKRSVPITTTRGCPFKCEFCGGLLVTGHKVRSRPVASVIAEIAELYHRFGVRWMNIVDDNFTADLPRAKRLCREILKLNLGGVSFASSNGLRMEFLDREILELMQQAGWEYISIAPESGSQRTLKAMRKVVNLELVKQKVSLIRSVGLKTCGFFILGYPGETVEDLQLTIDFATHSEFDILSFQFFQPLPGTPVWEKLVESGELNPDEESSTVLDVPYAPKGITKAQLRLWFFRAHFQGTLLHPRRIKAVLPYITAKKFWTFFAAGAASKSVTRWLRKVRW